MRESARKKNIDERMKLGQKIQARVGSIGTDYITLSVVVAYRPGLGPKLSKPCSGLRPPGRSTNHRTIVISPFH